MIVLYLFEFQSVTKRGGFAVQLAQMLCYEFESHRIRSDASVWVLSPAGSSWGQQKRAAKAEMARQEKR